jgi:D-3-phosphoglycerate dehydrogenase
MIGKKTIPLMKRGCILINAARGGLIESLDLVDDALRDGQFAAAGFDVLPEEPPTDHSLLDAWRARESWLDGRLIITPHNAFYSDRSWYDCRYKAAETARLYLEQNTLRNQIQA